MQNRSLPSSNPRISGDGAFIPPKARLVAAGLLFLLVAGLLFGKLVYLQVISPSQYRAWGDNQRARNYTITAPRGNIIDRNGEHLAISLRTQTIWADPTLVQEPEKAARLLAPILELEAQDLYEQLTQDNAFVYLKRKISSTVATQVAQLELAGVYSLPEYQRSNPYDSNLGLSVIGFVGSEDQGLGGVEYWFNSVLTGQDGLVSFEGNVWGNPVSPDLIQVKPVTPGTSLQISLDKNLQFLSERLIVESVEKHEAKGGTILASNPRTGEILAIATALAGEDGVGISDENRAVTWAYEPGSAIKPISFLGVLETELGAADSVRNVPDTYQIYDSEFTDSSPHEPEDLTITQILTRSSNIGTIFWAQDLGKNYLNYYLKSLGLGAPTNIELPGESNGLLLAPRDYSGTSLATIALGQGISVTPVQLLFAFNAIANDGIYVPPRLVTAQTQGDEWQSYPAIAEPRRVVSSQTASAMNDILIQVVEEGTGQAAQSDYYTVAGKTGTARKPQPTGGYLDADGNFSYITTFAGYFPAEDPQISIIVVLDEPQDSIYASATTAPIFAEFSAYAAAQLRIAPSPQLISAGQ